MNEEPTTEPTTEPEGEPTTEPTTEPAPTSEPDYTELLEGIQATLDNIETLLYFSVIVAGALFVCWIIKKAIDPLLS